MNKNLKKPNNQPQQTFALWILIVLLAIAFVHFFNTPPVFKKVVSFSELQSALKNDQIEQLTVSGDSYSGKFKEGIQGGVSFTATGPMDSEHFLELASQSSAKVDFEKPSEGSFWQQFLISWLPTIGLLAFFIFFMRQMQMGGGRAMSFGKAKTRLLSETQKKYTFKDVAGIDEAKEELYEIIDFLKEPQKFTKLGGRIPKGVLLMGPPGTGKTLLAKAIAGEAGVPFFSISGSDFVEMFVGVGASRVRDLFDQGKKHAPCIIFIDEIDAVGRHRGAGLGGGHDEREQTLNQLLVEMDGFESNEGVILIAATNRPDVLDPALMRPGRFDRRVVVPRPDLKGREEILKIHSSKVPLEANLDLLPIARGTPGFCGADLENLVNEAALFAARSNRKTVTLSDLEMAKDKVMMGSERRSMMISDAEKKVTAYHEAGHTLVARLIPGTDPVHKVTIIPRGMALGLTQQLPDHDKYMQTRKYTEDVLAILMGGRVAEELVFKEQTTGAGNDIEKATEIARRMVCEWGMSDKMGPLAFGKPEQQVFLGKDFGRDPDYSESTAVKIDDEVRRLVTENHQRATKIIGDNIEALERLALALLEFETLDGDQIDRVIRGEKLPFIPRPQPMVRNPDSGVVGQSSAKGTATAPAMPMMPDLVKG